MELSHEACCRIFASRDERFDGRLYIGVRTTGIYCRPVCPARTPKPEHVSFYPTAAAAREAGFRPCLRCRPELAPEVTAREDVPSVVARALALIEAGALDDGDVESLAARVGLSGRQLRRLFRRHLGATPVAVAQTRRIHLAKQLLHDTDLSMAEVAFAAGFGSVRRFNETFQRLYPNPPATLRRTRGAAKPAPEGITVRLPYQPPYDWNGVLHYFSSRLIPGVEAVSYGRYARTITLGDHAGTLVVEQGKGHTLQATVRFPALAALPRVIARLRRQFDLGANPELIRAHLADDPFLAPLVAARPGLRVPGAWDPFELAVRAILGQQVTVALATRQSGIITAAFGTPHDDPHAHALGLSHRFPTPEQLAVADVANLGLMPGARARALNSLGAALAEDPHLRGTSLYDRGRIALDLDRDEEAYRALSDAVADLLVAGDNASAAYARVELAAAALSVGQPNDAADAAEEAIAVLDRLDDPNEAARARFLLARSYRETGQPEQALALLDRVAEHCAAHDNPAGIGQMNAMAGDILDRLDRDEEAALHYTAAADSYHTAALALPELENHRRAAMAWRWAGSTEDSLSALAAADSLASDLAPDDPAAAWEQAMLHYDAARILAAASRPADALPRACAAADAFRSQSATVEAAMSDALHGRLLVDLDRPAEAEKLLLSALDALPANGPREQIGELLEEIRGELP